jgi:hypothetical protein
MMDIGVTGATDGIYFQKNMKRRAGEIRLDKSI